ncbi:MAG: FAD-dependent oxidoreductase [Acidimicrobiia bacterium]|nr:FAD-dependent oxidoreductase [Acidimicrobiia bacterium]
MTNPAEARYRSRSLWLDTVPESLAARPALRESVDADVVIVGAGFTGLWTAYELLRREPTLRVVNLEAEIAGFGASGRNGGWCSALFAGSRDATAKSHGRGAAVELQRAMFATIDEIGRVVDDEGIDAHFHKGGNLEVATRAPHVARLEGHLASERAWGFDEADVRWLEPEELGQRVRVAGARGALFSPHCARVHPARLVRGLAAAVERRGGTIYEQSRVREIAGGRVATATGEVRAPHVIVATEGYTPSLEGRHRDVAPVYSLMIATEPLSDAIWDAIGWSDCETLADGRHLIIYAQRTADNRIAFGGRGAPYHFASGTRDEYDRDRGVFTELRQVLHELFPCVRGARVTHEWGGPLAIPRDWYSSVTYDRRTGMGWAGGYVGDGVSTTNLAGRTLADLILEQDTELTSLPWVNHSSPKWEPEPFRWLGVNAGLRIPAGADAFETRTGRPSRWREAVLRRLVG